MPVARNLYLPKVAALQKVFPAMFQSRSVLVDVARGS